MSVQCQKERKDMCLVYQCIYGPMTLRFLSRYSRGLETIFLSIKRLTMGGNFLCNKFPVFITFSCFGLYLLLTIYSVLYKSDQRVSLVRQNNNIDNNNHHHHHHHHTACNFYRMSYLSGPPAEEQLRVY